jgi:hypothetical protein
MELDLEVRLSNLSPLAVAELAKRFPIEFPGASDASYQDVLIRATPKPQFVPNIDVGVGDFLQSLTPHADAIKKSKGTLRLGIFYDLSETVVFPFRLSVETVKALGDLNLSLDATGYPCGDDLDESEDNQ